MRVSGIFLHLQHLSFNMKTYRLRSETRKVQLANMEAETLQCLLMKSIDKLCQQNISFTEVVHVQGCIVFTSDQLDTLTVHLDDTISQESAKPKQSERKSKEHKNKSTKKRGRPRKYSTEAQSKNVSAQNVEECCEKESNIKIENQQGGEEVGRKQPQALGDGDEPSLMVALHCTAPSATVTKTSQPFEQHDLKSEPPESAQWEEMAVTGVLLDAENDNSDTDNGDVGQADEMEIVPIGTDTDLTSPSKKEDYVVLSNIDATKDPELIEEIVLASLGPASGSLWPDGEVWTYARRPKLYQYDKQFQDACQAIKEGMKYARASRKYNIPVSKLRYHINVRERLKMSEAEVANIKMKWKHSFHICKECGKACISKMALRSHETKHTGVRPYACHICSRTFSTKYILKAHVRRHDPNDKPFSCPYCKKKFLYRAEMSRHVIVHTGLKPYKCAICNQSFSKKSTLVNHQKRHTNERRHKCDQCAEAFISSQSLKRHLAKHNGVRQFACEQCPKQFWTQSDLKEHQKLHTNVKQHICSVCGMQFVRSNALNSHMNWVHTEVRAFVCNTCGKTFKKKHALLKHERNHTGITPYICEVCGQGFKWHTSRKLHMKKHQLVLPEAAVTVLPEAAVTVLPEAAVRLLPEAAVRVLPEAAVQVRVLPETAVQVAVLPEAVVQVAAPSAVEVTASPSEAIHNLQLQQFQNHD